MEFPELFDPIARFDAYMHDGATSSANRFLLDTFPNIVLKEFRPPASINYLVHYTTLDVLFSMLTPNSPFLLRTPSLSDEVDNELLDFVKKWGYLRNYDTIHSNDPNEGQFLIGAESDSHPLFSEYPLLLELLKARSEVPAYLASFISASDLEASDNLVYWRTYGKEGQGCSIAFPISLIDENAPLYKVSYGSDSVVACLDRISDIFKFSESQSNFLSVKSYSSYKNLPSFIAVALSPLNYLYKDKPYSYEHEARFVVQNTNLPSNNLFCHLVRSPKSGIQLRHFTNNDALSIFRILGSNSTITLGPTVPLATNICYVIKCLLERLGILGVTVSISSIDYKSKSLVC